MKADIELYNLIYEFYEARILCGYYRCGDRLPSISKISAAFHMAPETVRAALSVLEERGYLTVDARKVAKVVYQGTPSEFRKNTAIFLVPRERGIQELVPVGQLLLKPCWEAGLKDWETSEWREFAEHLITCAPDFSSVWLEFYIKVLSRLKNRLILNLYWEIVHYLRFPYLISSKLQHAAVDLKNRSPQEIYTQVLMPAYWRITEDLEPFIREARALYSIEDATPFYWRLHRQRPQMRYSLASRIIREIMYDHYPIGSRFPSLSQMAERYQVSMNTARRTVELLRKLGILETQQGRTAIICIKPVPFVADSPEIRESLRLYLEALHFLELTVEPVMLYVLRAATPEDLRVLEGQIGEIRQKNKEYACYEVCFSFITRQCSLEMVRECYGKLLELLTLGYPLALSRLKGASLSSEYYEFVEELDRALEIGDFESFSSAWRALVGRERMRSHAYLETQMQCLHEIREGEKSEHFSLSV